MLRRVCTCKCRFKVVPRVRREEEHGLGRVSRVGRVERERERESNVHERYVMSTILEHRLGGQAGDMKGFTHTWKCVDTLDIEEELLQVRKLKISVSVHTTSRSCQCDRKQIEIWRLGHSQARGSLNLQFEKCSETT